MYISAISICIMIRQTYLSRKLKYGYDFNIIIFRKVKLLQYIFFTYILIITVWMK